MWFINTLWILLLIGTLLWMFIMFFESFSILDAIADIWDTPVIGPIVLITTGVLTAMSIFGIKWILTTTTFWIVVGGVLCTAALTYGIIKAIQAFKRNKAKREQIKSAKRHRSKEKEYGEILGFNIPEGSIDDKNESLVDNLMDKYNTLISNGITANTKRLVFDSKILILHATSMRGELNNEVLYNRFFGDLIQQGTKGNFDILREVINTDAAITEILKESSTKLTENKMDEFIYRLDTAKQMDTSGVFFQKNKSKVEEQTKFMIRAYNAAKFEYAELKQIAKELNIILKTVRIFAYRNIKLAIDVIEYGRPNAGGKNLVTNKDSINITNNFQSEGLDIASLSLDSIEVIKDTLNVFSGTLNSIINDKNLSKMGGKRAIGFAAGVAAIETIGKIVTARNESINNNLEIQKSIIKGFPVIVDAYQKMQVEMLRTIELIRAIIKSNSGLYKIYEPLKNKVFGPDSRQLEMSEIMELSKAINAYKEISSSKL